MSVNNFGSSGVRRFGFNKNTQGNWGANPYRISEKYVSTPPVPYNPGTPRQFSQQPAQDHPRAQSINVPQGMYQAQDDQIQSLLKQIQQREAFIGNMRDNRQPATAGPVTQAGPGPSYNRKDFEEMKNGIVSKQFTTEVQEQRSYAEAQKKLEVQRQQQEYHERMEELQRIREEERAAEEFQRLQALKYRQDLDAQRQSRMQIQALDNQVETQEYQHGLDDIQRHMPQGYVPTNHTYMYGPNGAPIGFSTNLRFTKTMNKTLCYDPITGAMKDTSFFLPNTIKPEQLPKYQSSVIGPNKLQVERNYPHAANPALQQPKYTHGNPYVIPTNPIAGTTVKYPEPISSKVDYTSQYRDEFHGRRLMNPKQLVEYGSMALNKQHGY